MSHFYTNIIDHKLVCKDTLNYDLNYLDSDLYIANLGLIFSTYCVILEISRVYD